jgi:hypothetical protein
VGFIDGDGCIVIIRDGSYVSLKLVISLNLNDISTITYIKSVLNLGKISTHPSLKSPTVKLVINKTELQEVLFPLLIHHGIFFLTENRRAQYHTAIYIIQNNIKLSCQVPELLDIPVLQELPTSAEGYVNLHFFKD